MTDDLSRRVKQEARPGETWDEAIARLRKLSQTSALDSYKAPNGDEQSDFFVPQYDVGTRDSLSTMDLAVFRLSKKVKRIGEVVTYNLPDGRVTVSAGAAGMATIWDYDLVLMAISHITEATNRWREGKGLKPGRLFRPHISDVLKFCRRADGGNQRNNILESCSRLNTTHIAIQRQRKSQNGRVYTLSEGEALITRYKIITCADDKPQYVELEIAEWMYREVIAGTTPGVLTVHPDYFLLSQGLKRYIYRLARRAAGKDQAKWAFRTIYEHSGSAGTLKKFTFTLRKIIAANDLPEYDLEEERGRNSQILVMTNRAWLIGLVGIDGIEYRKQLIESGMAPGAATEEALKYAKKHKQEKVDGS